jgi:proteasome lid subunit RPN8/RPN11
LSTPFRLLVPPDVLSELVAQAKAELPNECCGMLAGVLAGGVGRVVRRIPLRNQLADPKRFFNNGQDLCRPQRECREAGLEFLAVYHSHPTSEPVPSRTDLEQHEWHGLATVIVSLAGAEPEVRAWWLTNESYCEADWGVEGSPSGRAGSREGSTEFHY